MGKKFNKTIKPTLCSEIPIYYHASIIISQILIK